LYSSSAYAPFGEQYAVSGTADASFTGQNSDTTSTLYDFTFREHSPSQGRWLSPDPSGLAAVSLANPQSWNRYAYVLSNPLALVDPLGLDCIYLHDDGTAPVVKEGDCWDENDDGYYVDGTVTNGDAQVYGDSVSVTYDVNGNPGGYFCEGDCAVSDNIFGGGSSVATSSGNSGNNIDLPTLDNRANALAQAMDKTGVQALKNPCTAAAFYAGSATTGVIGGGYASVATNGSIFPEMNSAWLANSYYIAKANALIQRVDRLKLAGYIFGTVELLGKAAKAGCDAMQGK
jgi:RHS repeat-associated protein